MLSERGFLGLKSEIISAAREKAKPCGSITDATTSQVLLEGNQHSPRLAKGYSMTYKGFDTSILDCIFGMIEVARSTRFIATQIGDKLAREVPHPGREAFARVIGP